MPKVNSSTGGSSLAQAEAAPAVASGPVPGKAPGGAPRRKPPVVLLAVLGIAAAAGLYVGQGWWSHHQRYVSTEDAQVAGNLISISSRVPGRLAALLVDEGDHVKAGQIVARLDDVDFRAQLAQAEAALAVARTGLATSETGVSLQTTQTSTQIAQAEAAVRAARASVASFEANATRAHADQRRIDRLVSAGGTSQQALEGARTAATAADSAATAAKSQLRGAEEALRMAQAGSQQVSIKQGGVHTVQAQIALAEAAVRMATLQLEHAQITSPVEGVVARRSANAGEQVAPGQAIFSVNQTDQVWIAAYIEETQINRVQPDEAVEVRVDAYPGQMFQAQVALVGAVTGSQFSILPTNNAAGNFTKVVQRIPVKIRVKDPRQQLKPGMSAVIDIDAPAR